MTLKDSRVAQCDKDKFSNIAYHLSCRRNTRSNDSVIGLCRKVFNGDILVDANISHNLPVFIEIRCNLLSEKDFSVRKQVLCNHIVPKIFMTSVMGEPDIGLFLKDLIKPQPQDNVIRGDGLNWLVSTSGNKHDGSKAKNAAQ